MGSFAGTGSAPDRVRPAPGVDTLPVGFGLVADRDLRVLSEGRVLVGGSPTRLVRLRPRAAALVLGWLDGQAVENRRADRTVARRLVAAGVMHPRPPAAPPGVLVSVVVPVRDRPEHLSRLLGSLGEIRCVVVDDCSRNGPRIEKLARDAGAEYVRLATHSGPAAARNAGMAQVLSPLVAFVDSDCVVPEAWLDGLIGHFNDPRVALVAPRIVTPAGPSWLDRYESARSPLDLGPDEGRIAPATRLAYAPSAAVVVRRAALPGRCFDERLEAGEDVDLVWRVVEAGWEARYVPQVQVAHASEVRPGRWLARRALYGSTAGPLSQRHPDAMAPARVHPVTVATWGLVAAGRPAAALSVAAGSTGVLAGRLTGVVDDPVLEAARLAAAGTARSLKPAVVGLTRVWGPVLALALGFRRLGRLRLIAGIALAVTATRDWRSRPRDLDPARYVALRVADDLAYGSGVWWGCWRARTWRPLVPVVAIRRRPRRAN